VENPRIVIVCLPTYLDIRGHKAKVLEARWKILELTEHKVAVVTQRGQGQATQVTQLSHFLRTDSTTLPVCLDHDVQEGHEWIIKLNWLKRLTVSRVVTDALSGVYCMWSPARSRSSREYRNPLQASVGFTVRCEDREYWMIYWGPGSLGVVRFGSSPTPFRRVGRFSFFLSLPLCRLHTGEGGGDGGRSQIIRRRESLVLFNHSILSDVKHVNLYGPKQAYAQLCWLIFCNVHWKLYNNRTFKAMKSTHSWHLRKKTLKRQNTCAQLFL